MDIYGISSQFTVDFLENNVVKVKKEKSNNDFKRIKVEQYFQNGQIVSAKVWKNDSLQYSCYVNGELVYFDEKFLRNLEFVKSIRVYFGNLIF